MKKKILKAAFVATFAMIAGYGVYNSQKDVVLSDIALANVEALARAEAYMPGGTCYGAGGNFSNVRCRGGYTICCWAHGGIYGKD